MGVIEWGSIAVAVTIAVSIIANVVIARRQESRYNKEQERQTNEQKWQTKMASAQLLLQMDEIMRHSRFKDVEAYIYGDTKQKPNEDALERYLNNLNTFAGFWEDEILTKDHMMEAYGNLMRLLWPNDHVQKFIEKKNRQYGEKFYQSLDKLYKEIQQSG